MTRHLGYWLAVFATCVVAMFAVAAVLAVGLVEVTS